MRLWGPTRTFRICLPYPGYRYTIHKCFLHSHSKEVNVNDHDKDFMAYGILPYLQKRINSRFLPPDQKAKIMKGGRPDYNTKPTSDQRNILDALNSNVSVIHKGGESQTGKSYALATYAVNYALKKKPVYGMFAMSKTVDCIIVVPTPTLVDKYAEYILQLIEDLPEECCPVRSPKNDDNYNRVPFKAQFWGSSEYPYTISSADKLPKNLQMGTNNLAQFAKLKVKGHVRKKKGLLKSDSDPPHVVVTTLDQFFVITKEKQNIFRHTKFLAFDNCDSMMNSTDIGEESTYYNNSGTEIKSKIELGIQKLQHSQMTFYVSRLKNQLRHIPKTSEVEWCRQAIQTVVNTKPVGQTYLKFDDVNVSDLDSTIDAEIIELLYNDGKKNTSDVSPEQYKYLRRLLKEKRRCFFKPIQYCFICEPRNPFRASIQKIQYENRHTSTLESLKFKIEHTTSDDPRHEEYLHKYNHILEQLKFNQFEQDKDMRVEFIKTCLFLLDSSKFFRESNLDLVNTGGFPKIKHQIGMSFHTSNGRIDVEKNLPNREETLKLVAKERVHLASGVRKLFGRCLSYYLQKESTSSAALKEMATSITENYRKGNPNDQRPFLYVIPRDCNKFEVDSSGHKVVHANKLIGTDINHYNMVLLGAETLLANSAFGKRKGLKTEIRYILDHESDLIYFYVFKLLSLPENGSPSLMIGIDESNPFDLFLLGRILLYNDLKSYVKFRSISELESRVELEYGLTEKAREFLRLQHRALKGLKKQKLRARREEKELEKEYKLQLKLEKEEKVAIKMQKRRNEKLSQFKVWMKKIDR